MDLTKFLVIVIFVVRCGRSCDAAANNVNAPDKDRPDGRSRPKKSAATEIYLALPPDGDAVKTGKHDGRPPTLIRLDPSAPNKFKGKFPTPIERFVQRIQNYFSVYNPPEYLNDLRPGIDNPDTEDGEHHPADPDYANESQIVLPCNGTSTIVIIPVPLESESGAIQNHYANPPDVPESYGPPPKSTTTTGPTTATPKSPCPEVTTTPKSPCPGVTTTTTTTTTTPKPPCPEVTTATPKPPCPEVTTTTPKPKCPEVVTTTTTTTTTVTPKCPEPTATTPKPKCPEETASKHEYPQEMITQRPFFPVKQSTSKPKPVSGYDGPDEAPPLNLVAKPVIGSTVVYFYKHPSTASAKPPSYHVPTTPRPIYEEMYTERTKPPILRLKQLLFPRLYAAFHPDE